ncbi:MAG: ECF transporter S component [Clostridia bacterium]|nr:ECF transporter S component [Clostridia bacterium]
MKLKQIQRLVTAALMAALVFVATLLIQIPIPATGGYVNFGDGFVILCGVLLGPLYGGLAAGIGAMLTDLITGYAVYIPATFLIKACMAVIAYLLVRRVGKRWFAYLLASVCAEALMVLGYFAFEALALGFGKAAIASLMPNLAQGAAGILIACILLTAITKNQRLADFFFKGE